MNIYDHCPSRFQISIYSLTNCISANWTYCRTCGWLCLVPLQQPMSTLEWGFFSIVHVNGLGLTLRVSVNPIMKCVSVKWCKLILCCVKQCKCKNNIYMVLHGSIKQ